jgi:putative ABC transport system permease protein
VTAIRVFIARLVSLVRARDLDDRLDEELRSHLAFAFEEHVARGMTPDAARRAAIRGVGSVMRTRETWRDTRGFPTVTALWQDLHYAARSYRKTPAFTIVALLSLTLAIGANTAIFSLLNALVLRELPVRDPERLVQVATVTRNAADGGLTYPMFEALSRQQQVFSSVIGWWGNTIVSADIDGAPAKTFLWAATGNLHSELGLTPAAGRLFSTSDMDLALPSAEPVAVISYAFWQRQFHGDPAAMGRVIRLEGVPFTILGASPRGFMGLGVVTEPDVTIPLTAVPLVIGHRPVASIKTRPTQWVRVIGRLRPGVTIEQARAHLETVRPELLVATVPADFSRTQRDDFLSMRLSVASAATGVETGLRSRYGRPLMVVLAIAGLVLLVACVNLASLMLSRAAVRRHEIAVRLALGASRWRLARQMLTEGLLLSVAGGACGVLFAFWGCRAIAALIFEEYLVPVLFDGTPDLRVVGVTTALAFAVGVLFSLAPMWCVWRERSAGALQQRSRTTAGTSQVGRWLVGAQIALSLVLVANAGLLVRSLSEVRSIQSGISRTDGVFVAYPSPRAGGYDHLDSDVYYQQVLGRISAVPGVHRASASLLKPATDGTGWLDLVAPIAEPSVLERGVQSTRTPVSPGFLDAVGVQVVKGRDFSWQDGSRGRPVTILSQSLARRLFGTGDPIGHRVRIGLTPERQDVEVIGVAADARLYDVKNPNLMAVYVPALQDPSANNKCFVIRGTNVPYGALKQAVESLGREDLGGMVTMRYITDRALLQERLMAMLSGFFGALALLLSGIGLYGLMAYLVAQRQREMGIRVALGADTARIMRDVIRDGLAVSLGGVATGLVAALAASQLIKSLLFGVTPRDPITMLATPAVLVAIAILASVVPAIRAARVDPMIALRAE